MIDSHNIQILIQHQQIGTLPRFDTANLPIHSNYLGDRAVVVSDSMRGNGMADGESFDLGGQLVTVKDGKATLSDGTIAGSVTNLHEEVKNLVSFGIPLEHAVKAATLTPAKVIGMVSPCPRGGGRRV